MSAAKPIPLAVAEMRVAKARADAGVDSDERVGGGQRERGAPARDKLIGIADELAELWRDADGVPYATVPIGDHRENYRVKSRDFRNWLTRIYAERHPRTLDDGKIVRAGPPAQALQDALTTICGIAAVGAPRLPVVRLARDPGGAVWIDLGDAEWRAVRIDRDGWRLERAAPLPFVRAAGLRALPAPETGGAIGELANFINVEGGAEGDDFKLIVAWLVMAISPTGPYPILLLNGEQGSAKSTATKVLRALIDPNQADVRALGRDDEPLQLAARNGWVCAFDNLSGIASETADALCRLSTGSAMAKRRLYTDGDEVLFTACRPIVANGIPALATRGDLADRALIVTLPTIAPGARRDEASFWAAFEAARPRLLGAILNAAACALRRRSEVQIERLPRMADFALWVEAAAPALGWAEGAFLAAFDSNRRGAVQDVLDSDPVAVAVRAMLDREGRWEGTPAELLAKLSASASDADRKASGWPRDATRMSGGLRRVSPALRQAGISVENRREPGGTRRRLIALALMQGETIGGPASRASPSVPASRTTVGPTGNVEEQQEQERAPSPRDAGALRDAGDAPPGSEPGASAGWQSRVRVLRS